MSALSVHYSSKYYNKGYLITPAGFEPPCQTAPGEDQQTDALALVMGADVR